MLRNGLLLSMLVLIGGFASTGCGVPSGSQLDIATQVAPQEKNSSDDLKRQIDLALETTCERKLSAETHAAWQVLHGCLAFDRSLRLKTAEGETSALDYLLSGRRLRGWQFEAGNEFEQRTGLRSLDDPGTRVGQGHADQWLGYLAACQLPLETKIVFEEKHYTLEDYLRQTEFDVPRNLKREYSWTLMALAEYRKPEHTWVASDGKTWSIERLVESELEFDMAESPCGGTHRMYGLAQAYAAHRRADTEDRGVWMKLRARLDDCISKAQEFQNADGSLSTSYFFRHGNSPDLADAMHASGHTFEFLAVALSHERLSEAWMERAAAALCKTFRKTRHVDLECGALYHAAHGLRIYRERRFGEIESLTLSDSRATETQ